MDKSSITKLLRIVTATVEGLDEYQIGQLLSGKAKLVFVEGTKSKEGRNSPRNDQAAIIARLNECRDRDEARKVLSEMINRDAVESLARAMKVHVVKHDRREDIEAKIIEFAIGGKLRTEAIQSLNLKGGSSDPEK